MDKSNTNVIVIWHQNILCMLKKLQKKLQKLDYCTIATLKLIFFKLPKTVTDPPYNTQDENETF